MHAHCMSTKLKVIFLNKAFRSTILEQGRIHGYLSRVRLGRGSDESLQASKQQNTQSKLDVTDRPTDRPTDGPTDRHSVL